MNYKILFLFLLFVTFSCKKADDTTTVILDCSQKRENIIGTWNVAITITTVVDKLTTVNTKNEIYQFKDDGTGKLQSSFSLTTFDWYIQHSPAKIIFTSNSGVISNDKLSIFNVINNEKNNHLWELEDDDENYRSSWKLIRKE